MKLSKLNFKLTLITILFLFTFLYTATLLGEEKDIDLLNIKISIDAEDASISHIIATMAKLSGCNIVLALEMTGREREETEEKKITIHLKDVPIEQALGLVVKSIGLSYRLVGEKTFLVGEKKRIEEEVGERSYIVNLNYIDVDKIVKALEVMPGQAVPIEGQNALMIWANPSAFTEISKRIKEVDIPQKQIEIRARLIEISISKAEKFGIDWSKLNRLTTILAEDPKNAGGVGLPYDYFDETGATPYGDKGGNPLGELPDEQYFQKIDGFKGIGHFSRQLTAFDITIDWLLEHNVAQLLTDTRVTSLNGEEAMIHIGEVIPFVITEPGREEYRVQVEREEVGIILKVRPSINKDGQITTKIEPEVSSLLELVGGYIPRIKVRKVTSTVTVPDGGRIIVGGLLSTNIVKKVNKIPILGSIPFIGFLFRHKHNVINKTDLIIEITPKVVSVEDQTIEFDLDEQLEKKLIKEKQKE
ncbi:MAG: type II secretion system protein GspD [Candidatus Cloacimonetes bacterium]|nr:type II secretion system protein GspD [Candidatus Cloacimonadota bacterium]